MSIATKIAKIGATVAGLSLAAGSFAMALPAAAQTTTTTTTSNSSSSQMAAIQAQIASLEAQLSALGGTSTSASVTFTRDLTVGSTGSDVTALQQWLIAKGFAIPAGATGYFGAQTKAALAAYQAANGISPAVGYFGPITRAHIGATGGTTTTTTTGGTTTTTTGGATLSGGEGSINNLQVLGAPTNVTLYQGQSGNVYGFQFLASGSDLDVNRVDFDLTNTGAVVGSGSTGGNDRPWSVLQTATLYNGTTAVATVDASNAANWSQDGYANINGSAQSAHQTYRIRFDNLNNVVKSGATAQYFVAFTAQNGVSNANQTTYQIQLAAQGVRATDAMGLQQYSSASAQNTTTFNVNNSAAGTVVLSTASDNPQTGTVMANQTASTQNVVLGAFTLQAQNAAVNLYTLPVTIVSTATSTALIEDVKLVENGTVVASQAVNSTTWAAGSNYGTLAGYNATEATTTFNNMNITIPAGTTQEFQIEADINSVGGTQSGNAPEGASAAVLISTANLAAADIEQGSNRVTPTGGLTGNAITFHVNGLSVDATPNSSDTTQAVGTTGTQTGTFTFTFNATAFGQDIFVSSTTNGYTFTFQVSGGGTQVGTTTITSTADRSPLGNYVIHAGQTRQITVSGTTNGNNAYVYATLTALKYGTTDANPLSSTLTLPTSYQTAPEYIHS